MEIHGERLEDLPQGAALDPSLKAAMTGLIRRVAGGQILPRGAGPEDPQDAVQHIARIAPRSSAPIAAETRFRQERRQHGPLRVGKVHTAEYDGRSYFVHEPFGVYEIGSSVGPREMAAVMIPRT